MKGRSPPVVIVAQGRSSVADAGGTRRAALHSGPSIGGSARANPRGTILAVELAALFHLAAIEDVALGARVDVDAERDALRDAIVRHLIPHRGKQRHSDSVAIEPIVSD